MNDILHSAVIYGFLSAFWFEEDGDIEQRDITLQTAHKLIDMIRPA